jgi:hypothetical protein
MSIRATASTRAQSIASRKELEAIESSQARQTARAVELCDYGDLRGDSVAKSGDNFQIPQRRHDLACEARQILVVGLEDPVLRCSPRTSSSALATPLKSIPRTWR